MLQLFFITLIVIAVASVIFFENRVKFGKDVKAVKEVVNDYSFNANVRQAYNLDTTIDTFVYLYSQRLNKAQLLLLAVDAQTNPDIALYLTTNEKMTEVKSDITVKPIVFNEKTPYDILLEAYVAGDMSVIDYLIPSKEISTGVLQVMYKYKPSVLYTIASKANLAKNYEIINSFTLDNSLIKVLLSNPTADANVLLTLLEKEPETVRIVVDGMLKNKEIVSSNLLAAIAYSFPSIRKSAVSTLADKEHLELDSINSKALTLIYL